MLLRVHYAVLGIRPVLHRGLGTGCSGHLHRVTAAIAKGKHPVPSRTRKLSLSAPMVLRGRPRGRVGHRRTYFTEGRLVWGGAGNTVITQRAAPRKRVERLSAFYCRILLLPRH